MRGDGGRGDCEVVARMWSDTPVLRNGEENEDVDLGLGNLLLVGALLGVVTPVLETGSGSRRRTGDADLFGDT